VNLGGDADTVGAVYGQLAGAYYGASGIPKEWADRITRRDNIRTLADRLLERAST
jgi:ADP-ribosyl-[dinitrogen reductase] hydrolase